jgi:hypothetical protein
MQNKVQAKDLLEAQFEEMLRRKYKKKLIDLKVKQ